MTDWEPPRTVAHHETSLAFAVSLVDEFTGDRPDNGVDVALETLDATPVSNPGGYFVFLDLNADEVIVTVDGGDRYADERRRVVLDDDADETGPDDTSGGAMTHVVTDRSEPVEITLTPAPGYEFPPTATVVRGHVRDADSAPVAGATVSLREFDPEVETTATGEFALFVPVTAEDIQRRDGKNVVVVSDGNGRALADGDGADPTLVVRHPDHGETAEQIEVAAGTRTVHYVTLE